MPMCVRFILRIYRKSAGRGACPAQRRTGSTGNREYRGSAKERSHRTKREPLAETMTAA
jgi:hypothetical protein